MNFRFIGKMNYNDIASERPSLREGKTKNGNEYKSLSFGISANRSNWGFVELFGMKRDVIKTKDTSGANYDVDWNNRFDEDVINEVANYRKIFVNDTVERETRKAFISEYDAIEYVINNIDKFKGKKIVVTGSVEKNEYNGELSNRFNIKGIYIAADDAREGFRVTTRYFYTKDDIDLSEWKNDKKIVIDGYISSYIASERASKYVKHQIVFDASKIDYNNPEHVNIKDFNLDQLKLSEEDGTIKNSLKGNTVYGIDVELSYLNGAEEVEFDESTLTENQKRAIELGVKTVDDFKPSGTVYGDRVTEYKIVGYNLRGDSSDGAFVIDDTLNEFMDNVYLVTSSDNSVEEDDDLKDLFS